MSRQCIAEPFEGQDNQCVADEYGERLAKSCMNGWAPASRLCIIEAGGVIVNQ
jgi:hypothetical protein